MRHPVTEAVGVEVVEEHIRERFALAGITLLALRVRHYPQETAFIVEVNQPDLRRSASLGNELDEFLADGGVPGFVAVRAVAAAPAVSRGRLKDGVRDARAVELTQLLTARARTSEAQPSLDYIPNAAASISTVLAPRHHLIFGRRGAGKTAMLVEAKNRVEELGAVTTWVNVQTYRRESPARIFLWTARRLANLIRAEAGRSSTVADAAGNISEEIDRRLGQINVETTDVDRLIPFVQHLVRSFQEITSQRIYIFLDDFYYVPRDAQPELLDMLHSCLRDCDAWLKVASIRNLTRWFRPSPPVGLQTGQDADHIDLDVTLEDPLGAKRFLETMLASYAKDLEIGALSNVFAAEALDRLVLASGAVPRDYLVLSASAIGRARLRENAKLVGVQDVNGAAGDAARTKINELEDDLAASGTSAQAITALQHVRRFCVEEKQYTFFAVDFKDKEMHPGEYATLAELMDVRLVHLVNASVSDEHRAGEKAEVFMLDLSQFSGQRLKKFLRVLDFVRGHIVLKETGKREAARIGDTPKNRLSILRRAPRLDLADVPAVPVGPSS
jgi:hypothetical protein